MDRSSLISSLPRALVLALALAVASGGATLAQGVASLASPSPEPAAGTVASPSAPQDTTDAFLGYAACMREHGVDMPDPEFGPGGTVRMIVGGPGQDGENPDPETMRAAEEACRDLIPEPEAPDLDPEEVAELQEGALAFTACMREQGVDMPDPTFTEDGGVQIGFEQGDGVDPFSPEFEAAQEACRDVNPMAGAETFADGES